MAFLMKKSIEDLKLIKNKKNLTFKQISEILDIPYVTIKEWITYKRTPPQYTLNLIVKFLEDMP